jgi:hypothetical protein
MIFTKIALMSAVVAEAVLHALSYVESNTITDTTRVVIQFRSEILFRNINYKDLTDFCKIWN